jgi:hypothetical protein
VSNFMIGYWIVTSLMFVWNIFIFYKRNDGRVTLGSLLLSLVSFIPILNAVGTILLVLDTIIDTCALDDEFDKILELANITLYEKDKDDE